jgi:hypothetical protein
MPVTGQFNLLTASSFDSPEQLFSADSFARSIAYVSLVAPAGQHADWSMRGALTQGDLSSWFLAAAYTTRARAPRQYDVGFSYSPQRYDGGNPTALREVTDGNRNVGVVYGDDTFAIASGVSVTYGASLLATAICQGMGLQSRCRRDRDACGRLPHQRARVQSGAGAWRGGVPAALRGRHLASAAADLLVSRSGETLQSGARLSGASAERDLDACASGVAARVPSACPIRW